MSKLKFKGVIALPDKHVKVKGKQIIFDLDYMEGVVKVTRAAIKKVMKLHERLYGTKYPITKGGIR